MTASHPRVSFCVPVRNGQRRLPALFDSLLAQHETNIEVVVSDNCSDDDTAAVCAEYAARDPRVRFSVNTENIGLIPNFNKVLELARGDYFRWIGDHDWVEADYAGRCADELDQQPEAVGVTTYIKYHLHDGSSRYVEYDEERLAAPQASRRFARFLWFLSQDYAWIDPIYTLFRRDVVMGSRRLRILPNPDYLLSAELTLLGPFHHLPELLAHRRRDDASFTDMVALCRKLHPTRYEEMMPTLARDLRNFSDIVRGSDLSAIEQLRCQAALGGYAARHGGQRLYKGTRRTLSSLVPGSIKPWIKQHTLSRAT